MELSMEDKTSELIYPTFRMRRLRLGEKRQVGDWYLVKWRNELVRLVDKPPFWKRKINKLHLPHYRMCASIINLK